MSLSILQINGSDKTETWLPFSLSARFAIAAAGIVVCWWLASRPDVEKLTPLATFFGRAGQIAPTLIEGALGFAFSIWLIALAWEFKARSAQTPAQGNGGQLGKRILLLALALVGVVASTPNVLHFLWPSYPAEVSRFARVVFDLIVLLGIFIQPSKKEIVAPPTQASGLSNAAP